MPEKFSKDAVRKAMLQRRVSQPAQEVQALSLQAQEALLAEKVWDKAQRVALYMATKGEVQTQKIIEHAWQHGKDVYFPRCNSNQQGQMDFIACHTMQDLTQGKYGIWEPKPTLPIPNQEALHLDILLIPGIAFTRQGQRLGFGGGYYDRFLSKAEKQKTLYVALAFSWQILEELPTQAWDIPVHVLVSDKGIVWI